MQKMWVQSPGWEDSLEKEMVTHSRGGVKSGGSWKIFWPQHCPPDTKLSRDKPVSSVTLYALSAAKEVLHFPLFSLPSLFSDSNLITTSWMGDHFAL